jgi:hypothetical protein
MAKRAQRLNIDMNVLGISSLQSIQATLNNELAHATEKGEKLQLIFWTTQVKMYLKERTGQL